MPPVIRRFTRAHNRRKFLQASAGGLLQAGILCSPWSAFAKSGSAASAYPDELLSLDEYTHGQLAPGAVINRENVELVRELLDPVRYRQIFELGRQLIVAPTTNDLFRLNPHEYLEATLRNQGTASFDANGNVVTCDGQPWVGGNPFPKPTSALEVFAAHTLSWGRHDLSVYAAREYDLDALGTLQYEYASVWAEMAATGRTVVEPRPYWRTQSDILRYQSVFFLEPGDVRGTAFLNVWPYDQSQLPHLSGYLPAYKRVRSFPANQRFEPLIPGSELYLSDAWAAGDPFLMWGNYRIVHRGPYLGAVSGGWSSEHPNWEHKTHGGPGGTLFWNTTVELVPEAIVVEAEPVRFTRAPVSKKRVWFDARTLVPLAMISYDRRGLPFRFFDASYARYDDGRRSVQDGTHPYWSWTTLHAFNVQTSRMTRIEQVREVAGGHKMRVNDPGIYEMYLTPSALQRVGA